MASRNGEGDQWRGGDQPAPYGSASRAVQTAAYQHGWNNTAFHQQASIGATGSAYQGATGAASGYQGATGAASGYQGATAAGSAHLGATGSASAHLGCNGELTTNSTETRGTIWHSPQLLNGNGSPAQSVVEPRRTADGDNLSGGRQTISNSLVDMLAAQLLHKLAPSGDHGRKETRTFVDRSTQTEAEEELLPLGQYKVKLQEAVETLKTRVHKPEEENFISYYNEKMAACDVIDPEMGNDDKVRHLCSGMSKEDVDMVIYWNRQSKDASSKAILTPEKVKTEMRDWEARQRETERMRVSVF